MLAVRNLSKTFPSGNGSPIPALDSISLSADAGNLLCVLGPNGSGKTTFLKILAGLILPDSGQAVVAGHDVLTETRQVQEKIGFSPADTSFYGRLTGFENLRFFSGLRGLDASALRERLAILQGPLGLDKVLRIPYQKASSGMKQRLSLARALLHHPSVLLLDEPTRSIDPEGAEKVLDYVRQDFLGRANRLVLWSAQQPQQAWEIATHLLILRAGKVLAYGTPEELSKRARASSPAEAYGFWSQRHLS